jgi:hypothetical protein
MYRWPTFGGRGHGFGETREKSNRIRVLFRWPSPLVVGPLRRIFALVNVYMCIPWWSRYPNQPKYIGPTILTGLIKHQAWRYFKTEGQDEAPMQVMRSVANKKGLVPLDIFLIISTWHAPDEITASHHLKNTSQIFSEESPLPYTLRNRDHLRNNFACAVSSS